MRLLTAVAALLILLPAASVRARGVQIMRRLPTSLPVVALTIDTDVGRGYEEAMLNTLRERDVRATFAITGMWAEQNPDLLHRMVAEGHRLINHSWSHAWLTRISPQARAEELARTADVVRALSGAELAPFLRPPYGAYNASVLRDMEALGYTSLVWWTIDSDSWRGLTPEQVTRRVVAGSGPGSIVLMHSGPGEGDALALPAIIDGLRARGLSFARIGDPPPDQIFFAPTGHTVGGGFLRFWDQFGGLARFGYPLTAEFEQGGRVVQYFERARFEHHPGAWPARHDVLLGLLGRELTAGRAATPGFAPVADPADPSCTYVAATGHSVCNGFRAAWAADRLGLLGLPLSEELSEHGLIVQYFERARLEWHADGVVRSGRLGAERLAADSAHHGPAPTP